MSLLLATQITAVVLAVGAIVTAVFAILAFRKQSAEVTMLQEDRQHEAVERRRAQAAQVFTWVGERPVHPGEAPQPAACVRNTSRQPVYDISVGWGSSGMATWRVLLPGHEDAIPGAGSSVADGTLPIEIERRGSRGGHGPGPAWRPPPAGSQAPRSHLRSGAWVRPRRRTGAQAPDVRE